MLLEVIFPHWRAYSTSLDILWDEETDLADADAFFSILCLVLEDQKVASTNGPDTLNELSEAIIKDVLALQAAPLDGCDPVNLRYLQFEITIFPLRHAINRGEFGTAYDWFLNGFSDELGPGVVRRFNAERMREFVSSDVPWIAANLATTISDWSGWFYYYCRRSAALFDVAHLLLPSVLHAIDKLDATDDRAINSRCMIANWAVQYDQPEADTLVQILRVAFNDRDLTEETRTRIAVLFATVVGERTERPPREWAEWSLQNSVNHLNAHERLQLLLTLIESVEDWDRLRTDIYTAVEDYAATLRPLQSPVAIAQATDQRSELLNPAFVLLHRFRRERDFLELLQRWYDVPIHLRLAERVFFVSLNHQDGTAFLGKNSQLVVQADDDALKRLVRITNQALGLAITIVGEPELPVLNNRLAQPDYNQSVQFEDALVEAYCFDQLNDETAEDAGAIALMPGHPHPVQALMAKVRNGIMMPITSSLQQPEADRPIRRALLWDTQGDFFSTFEIEAVEALLTSAGAEAVQLMISLQNIPIQ